MSNRQERVSTVLNTLCARSSVSAYFDKAFLKALSEVVVDELDALPRHTDNVDLVKEVWWNVELQGTDDNGEARTEYTIDQLIGLVRSEFLNTQSLSIVNSGFEDNAAQFSSRAVTFDDSELDSEVFSSIMENLENIAVQRAIDKYPIDEDECTCEYEGAGIGAVGYHGNCPVHGEPGPSEYTRKTDPGLLTDYYGGGDGDE